MSAGPEVWAGVLAAGAGRRLGGIPKALLRRRGLTFLETIASVARRGGASGVAVVLGHHAAIVGELASQVSDRLAYNPAPDRGMGSSARELSRVVPEGVALLLWPVDTPAITEETVRRLALDGRLTGADIYQIGDGGYGGMAIPENILAFATAIKGKRHTYRRTASTRT